MPAGDYDGDLGIMEPLQQHLDDGVDITKELEGFFHGHIQHLGDILALIPNFKSTGVKTLTSTIFAGHSDISHELHFHPVIPHSLAGGASSSSGIEAETTGGISLGNSILGGSKKFPDGT